MTTKNKGGRPTKYDPKYCEMIIEHMSDGASMTSFAAEIGVARSTINEWGEKNPEFSEAINVARSAAVGGESTPAIVIFGLKNMSPEDWRDKQEIDHRSTDGSMSQPKQIQIVAPDHVDKTS